MFPHLIERTDTWRREFLRAVFLEAAARLSTWAFAFLAAAMAVDRVFFLPQQVRVLLLLVGAAALVWAVLRLIAPALRRDWPGLFAQVSREFPDLRDHLLSAWELREKGSGHISEDLRLEHIRRTEELLSGLPRRPVFAWTPSLWARRGAMAAVCGGLVLPWAFNGHSLQRLLAPWRDRPLELFIGVAPGTVSVDWGADAVIEVKKRAPGGPRRAKDVRLWLRSPYHSSISRSGTYWSLGSSAAGERSSTLSGSSLGSWGRSEEGSWKAASWDRSLFDGARLTFRGLTEATDYKMTWRDLESRVYTLTPVPVPQWREVTATVHAPQGEGAVVVLSPARPLGVLRGSWITLTGSPNQKFSKAVLRVSDRSYPMEKLASGSYRAGFVAKEDSSFSFELISEDGRADPTPPVYRLLTTSDEAPRVKLLSPLMALQASPSDTIPIIYSLEDDFGLGSVSLLVQHGKSERETELRRFSDSRKEFIGDHSWQLKGLPPGITVRFRLKVRDNAVPPHVAYSRPGIVEIVDFAAWHRSVEELWLKTESSLTELWKEHSKIERSVADMAGGEDVPGGLKDLEKLPEGWKSFARELADLARAMEADAYANPGLAEQFEELSKQLASSADHGLKKALESARSRDYPEAERRLGRLKRQLEAAKRLMDSGRKVQGLQDFYSESSRMSQAGARLEETLEALAGRKGAPTKKELANLKEALGDLRRQLEAMSRMIESLPKPDPDEAEFRRAYELPLESALTAASALQAALERGDYAAAARIAREMTERLSQIQRALSEAALDASMPVRQAERMGQVQAVWDQAVREQSKAVEETQGLEEKRLAERLKAQKQLLARLEERQARLISSATAAGATARTHLLNGPGTAGLRPRRRAFFPVPALTPMRYALKEFQARKIVEAPIHLEKASSLLRIAAVLKADEADSLEWFAMEEDDIRSILESDPKKPDQEGADLDFGAATQKQAAASRKTGELHKQLEALADRTGLISGPLEKVEEAMREQKGAEGALGSRRSQEGLRRQENALKVLEEGRRKMEEEVSRQRKSESAMRRPFERPAGGARPRGAARAGAAADFVPLPTAKDYRPPVELREELERSLKESRPSTYDKLIREYFKRIAQ